MYVGELPVFICSLLTSALIPSASPLAHVVSAEMFAPMARRYDGFEVLGFVSSWGKLG